MKFFLPILPLLFGSSLAWHEPGTNVRVPASNLKVVEKPYECKSYVGEDVKKEVVVDASPSSTHVQVKPFGTFTSPVSGYNPHFQPYYGPSYGPPGYGTFQSPYEQFGPVYGYPSRPYHGHVNGYHGHHGHNFNAPRYTYGYPQYSGPHYTYDPAPVLVPVHVHGHSVPVHKRVGKPVPVNHVVSFPHPNHPLGHSKAITPYVEDTANVVEPKPDVKVEAVVVGGGDVPLTGSVYQRSLIPIVAEEKPQVFDFPSAETPVLVPVVSDVVQEVAPVVPNPVPEVAPVASNPVPEVVPEAVPETPVGSTFIVESPEVQGGKKDNKQFGAFIKKAFPKQTAPKAEVSEVVPVVPSVPEPVVQSEPQSPVVPVPESAPVVPYSMGLPVVAVENVVPVVPEVPAPVVPVTSDVVKAVPVATMIMSSPAETPVSQPVKQA